MPFQSRIVETLERILLHHPGRNRTRWEDLLWENMNSPSEQAQTSSWYLAICLSSRVWTRSRQGVRIIMTSVRDHIPVLVSTYYVSSCLPPIRLTLGFWPRMPVVSIPDSKLVAGKYEFPPANPTPFISDAVEGGS